MKSPLKIGCVLVFLLCNSTLAQRQLHLQHNMTFSMRIFDSLLLYPAPSWIKDYKDLPALRNSKINRQRKKGTFQWEMIPPHETFSTWSQLYGIGAYYVKNADTPLYKLRENSLQVFNRACGRQNTFARTINDYTSSNTTLLICLASPYAPKESGYGKDIGEIMLLHTLKTHHQLIKVYHEWRGKSFNMNNKSNWPVSQYTLNKMIKRFESIRIKPMNHDTPIAKKSSQSSPVKKGQATT